MKSYLERYELDFLIRCMPFTYSIFQKYDRLANANNGELSVSCSDRAREADTLYYHINCGDADIAKKLNESLDKEVETTCTHCGCNKSTVKKQYGHYSFGLTLPFGITDPCFEEAFILCPECLAYILYKTANIGGLIRLKTECPDLSGRYQSLRIMVRNPQGELDYVKLEFLYCLNHKCYLATNREGYRPYKLQVDGLELKNPNDFFVEVSPLGIYTGWRDVTNERIYSGDVICCSGIDGSKFSDYERSFSCGKCSKYVIAFNPSWNTGIDGLGKLEWGADSMDNNSQGFGVVPLRGMINPVVVGNRRKITTEQLEVLPTEIREDVIDSIRHYEKEWRVSVLE